MAAVDREIECEPSDTACYLLNPKGRGQKFSNDWARISRKLPSVPICSLSSWHNICELFQKHLCDSRATQESGHHPEWNLSKLSLFQALGVSRVVPLQRKRKYQITDRDIISVKSPKSQKVCQNPGYLGARLHVDRRLLWFTQCIEVFISPNAIGADQPLLTAIEMVRGPQKRSDESRIHFSRTPRKSQRPVTGLSEMAGSWRTAPGRG
jgi:hypothetical protein